MYFSHIHIYIISIHFLMLNKSHNYYNNTSINNILSSVLLPNLKLIHLHKFSSLIGGPKTGSTKTEKCHNLEIYLSQLDKFVKPLQIVSIDTGLVNFAWSKFVLSDTEKLPSLIQWEKFNLYEKFFNDVIPEGTKFSPSDTSYLTSQLTDFILNGSKTSTNVLFTIERQRLRTNGSKFVTDPILNVNILEHLLFYALQNLNYGNEISCQNRFIVSSDPGRMTNYWLANQRFNSKDSKKLRIKTAMDLLNHCRGNITGKLFTIDSKLSEKISNLKDVTLKNKSGVLFDLLGMNPMINGKRKDDDLADSFLHGLAWSMWIQTYRRLLYEIDQYGGGETFKLSEWIDYNWHHHIELLDSITKKI